MHPASNYQTEHRRPDKLKTSIRTRATFRPSTRSVHFARAAILIAFLFTVFTIFQTSGSHAGPSGQQVTTPAVTTSSGVTAPSASTGVEREFGLHFLTAAPFQSASESVQTFDADCTTPKDAFTLGDTVCVKATVPFSFLVGFRRINIIGPSNVVRASQIVNSLTQEFSFTLPATDQTTLGGETFDNRGSWRADLSSLSSSRRASASFDASAATAAADLQIVAVVNDDTVGSGGTLVVTVLVLNAGPDAAEDVVVTPPSHTGLSLESFVDTDLVAPNNECEAPCTIASLARRGVKKFIATYNVTAPTGTKIVARGSVTSDTQDPRPSFDYLVNEQNPAPPANTNVATIFVTVGAPEENQGCTLTCPANVVATANTTVSSQFGAFVTYGAASQEGDCGEITNNPVSGSFFAVGTHTITSSASGGGSCTFTVKVLDTPAPTITCPVNKFVTDTDSSGAETVTVGTPTFTASGGGTVTGLRSDSTPAVLNEDGEVITPEVPKALTDPYPVGVTSILWTVTDADGRTATCTQTVTVSVFCDNDTTPPTITAPDDITVPTGAGNTGCSVTLDDELGQPEVNDNCSATYTVSGVPAGNNFAPGTYTLTYTATDAAGNTASDTQTVIVIEATPPIIFAPPDASYTCLTDVPAASPSQAGGPLRDAQGLPVQDDNGNLVPGGTPFDNCGTPTVAVTETSSGAGTAASPKIILRTFTATDATGNTASAVQTITVIDSTPPTISCPADITVYLPLNSTATSTVVNYTAPTGSDNCSGATTTQTAGLASGASFPVGTTTNTFRATDAVGNVTECSFTVTVLYNFTGFFSPVGNLPTLNVVNAGRAIPVKFSLSGDKGMNIFAANSPQSGIIPCDASAPAVDLTDTLTAGSSSLNYDATSDQYNYVWATSSSWAGTCRQLVVTLNDGTVHIANFKFK